MPDHDALTAAIERMKNRLQHIDTLAENGIFVSANFQSAELDEVRQLLAAAEVMAALERILRLSGLQAYGDDAVSAIHNLAATLGVQEAQE